MTAIQKAREALDEARKFIAAEYADASAEMYGEWLASEARPVFDKICRALADMKAETDATATIECPTCRGDGNDITGIYDQCMNCNGTGQVSLASATPADVGELVERLREKANKLDDMQGFSAPSGKLEREAATALERVVRDRDEALRWAGCWHRICQTIATVLELPEPEADTFAASVRDKMSDAEAKLAEARKVIEPFAARAGKLDGIWRDHETTSMMYGNTGITVGDLRAARRFLEETK